MSIACLFSQKSNIVVSVFLEKARGMYEHESGVAEYDSPGEGGAGLLDVLQASRYGLHSDITHTHIMNLLDFMS